MIKNDIWIKEQAKQGMIAPFEPALIRKIKRTAGGFGRPDFQISEWETPAISYGLSSYGYDIRLSPKDFRIFRHIPGHIVDPKNFYPSRVGSNNT